MCQFASILYDTVTHKQNYERIEGKPMNTVKISLVMKYDGKFEVWLRQGPTIVEAHNAIGTLKLETPVLEEALQFAETISNWVELSTDIDPRMRAYVPKAAKWRNGLLSPLSAPTPDGWMDRQQPWSARRLRGRRCSDGGGCPREPLAAGTGSHEDASPETLSRPGRSGSGSCYGRSARVLSRANLALWRPAGASSRAGPLPSHAIV